MPQHQSMYQVADEVAQGLGPGPLSSGFTVGQ